eukprot:m.178902 g.178902  ORF g.178902 m.178902 type:complete len:705 (+) comp39196_c0_seq8:124-2238(+)
MSVEQAKGDELLTQEKTDLPATADPSQDADDSVALEDAPAEPEVTEEKESKPGPSKKRVPVTKIDEEVEIVLEKEGPGSREPKTVFQLLEGTVERFGATEALCVKRNGDWVKWTYDEYFRDVKRVAKSFIKLGLEPFHAVGIIGFNAPEWLLSELGAIYAGGVACGIYTTNSPEASFYVLEDSKANIVVCENDIQVQKILKIREKLPHLKAIVQYTGELKQKEEGLYTWDEMIKEGESTENTVLEERKGKLKPGNCCILVYTSGTTGNPKGVMISHDNATWTAEEAAGRVALACNSSKGTISIVSFLPLSHIAAQIGDVFCGIAEAYTVYFAQPDALKGSLRNTLTEVRPHVFVGVPRVYEKFMEAIQKSMLGASGVRRFMFEWASNKARQGNQSLDEGNSPPWGWTIATILLKKIHKVLGLDRCGYRITSAAPLSREAHEFFQSVNLPLCEAYGMSESTGPHTMALPWKKRLGTCGPIFSDGAKSKIVNPDEKGNGEVCMYGRHVFMGYVGLEEKSREALDEDGWLHTGDIGNIDKDGFLTITGRIKEIIITSGGENIAPVPIEDVLKAQMPFVSNIMLIGEKRKFLSCLITLKVVIDPDTGFATDELQATALHAFNQLGCSAAKCSEIIESKNEAVFKAIQKAIEHYNDHNAISRAQKIQKWTLLPGDFTVPGEELGPTLKLKRPVVVQKYKEAIDAFYQDA